MTIRSWVLVCVVFAACYVSSSSARLGSRFRPAIDRSIEPTSHLRFYAVSTSWPCPWLTALVNPKGDRLMVGAQFALDGLATFFSYSEDTGFMTNTGQYLFLDPNERTVSLMPQPHPEVVWRNGTVAYQLKDEMGNTTYGASLTACPVAGTSFEYTITYNSTCSGGHRVQLRAVGEGIITDQWTMRTGQDERPHGSAQDKGSKKGSAGLSKRDAVILEGSPEFEERLRLRLMGLIE